MAKIKRVDQIRRILQTYLQTQSIKATAARLQVSKNTVREYKRRAETYPAGLACLLSLSDKELHPIIYPDEAGAQADRQLVFQGKVDHYIKELQRPHVTRMLLYEEYKKDGSVSDVRIPRRRLGYGLPITDCPDCGAKDSLIRILLPPNARAPPADFVYVAVK